MMLMLVDYVIFGWRKLVKILNALSVMGDPIPPPPLIGMTQKTHKEKMIKNTKNTECPICQECKSDNIAVFNTANYCLNCGYISSTTTNKLSVVPNYKNDIHCMSCGSFNCGLFEGGAYCMSCGFPFLGTDHIISTNELLDTVCTGTGVETSHRSVENSVNEPSNVIDMVAWKKARVAK